MMQSASLGLKRDIFLEQFGGSAVSYVRSARAITPPS